MEHLYSLPLYQQVAAIIAVGSAFLCLFFYLYGWMFCHLAHKHQVLPDPPLFRNSNFPTVWDKLYTLLFCLAYTSMVVCSIGSDNRGNTVEMGTEVAIGTLLMYIPMILRLALLKRPALPRGTCLRAIASIPIALFILLALDVFIETFQVSQWISDMTRSPLEQDVIEYFRYGSMHTKLVIVASACIIAPLGEECFFRGFLYNVLKGKTGVVAAALCSSLYFGAIHGALVQLLPLTLFGLVQCYLYESSRTLWVPIAFHFVFNSLSLSLVYFNVLPS